MATTTTKAEPTLPPGAWDHPLYLEQQRRVTDLKVRFSAAQRAVEDWYSEDTAIRRQGRVAARAEAMAAGLPEPEVAGGANPADLKRLREDMEALESAVAIAERRLEDIAAEVSAGIVQSRAAEYYAIADRQYAAAVELLASLRDECRLRLAMEDRGTMLGAFQPLLLMSPDRLAAWIEGSLVEPARLHHRIDLKGRHRAAK